MLSTELFLKCGEIIFEQICLIEIVFTADCADPGSIENGYMQKSPAGKPFCFGDKIIHRCKEGYKLEGDAVTVCTTTGQYSKLAPTCVKNDTGLFQYTTLFSWQY